MLILLWEYSAQVGPGGDKGAGVAMVAERFQLSSVETEELLTPKGGSGMRKCQSDVK